MNTISNQQKSLEELEKIYSKRKPIRREVDPTFDRLHISADELKATTSAAKKDDFEIIEGSDSDSSDHSTEDNYQEKKKNFVLDSDDQSENAIKPIISANFARSSGDIPKLKKIWITVAVVMLSLGAVYQCFEIAVLNTITKEQSVSLKSSMMGFLAEEFSQKEMLLFMNVHLNILLSIVGLVVMIYSAVTLLLNDNNIVILGFKLTGKKVAKRSFRYLTYGYVLGLLIHSAFYWLSSRPKTVRMVLMTSGYLLLRGGSYYLCMMCFRKAIDYKHFEPVAFKNRELKSLTRDIDQLNVDDEWKNFHMDLENKNEGVNSQESPERHVKLSFDFDFKDWKQQDTESEINKQEKEN